MQHQIATLREAFPGTRDWIYLQTSATSLMPLAARDAMLRYLDGRIEEGGEATTMFDAVERVRNKFAAMLGAEADEIAIVKSVSEGINLMVTSLPWQRGDNAVLCGDIEHPNSIYALYKMRDRYGIDVRLVPPTSDFATPIEAIANHVDDHTRLVIASTVTYTTGARTDLDALAALCRRHHVLLLIDGAQSIGALELDTRTTAIDAMAVGASKYLCGPHGFGFLYVRRDVAETLQPGSLARYGVDLGEAHEGDMGGEEYQLMPAARRFELGIYNFAGANATEASLDLLTGVGVPAIEAHVLALARSFTDGLLDLGLPVMSGRVDRHFSHVVVVGEVNPEPETRERLQGMMDHLAEQRVKLSMRSGRLRFSFHVYNTQEEVDCVLSMVGKKW
jgi:cysteine desulfurase/selenocysteine lyase